MRRVEQLLDRLVDGRRDLVAGEVADHVEGGSGDGETEKKTEGEAEKKDPPKQEPEKKDPPAGEPEKKEPKVSDNEAKLLKEVMERKDAEKKLRDQ